MENIYVNPIRSDSRTVPLTILKEVFIESMTAVLADHDRASAEFVASSLKAVVEIANAMSLWSIADDARTMPQTLATLASVLTKMSNLRYSA